jgi:hypothetical protein
VDALAARLAQQVGGHVALHRALQSRELATLRFDDGLDVMGTVAAVSTPSSAPISTGGAQSSWVRIGGRPAAADAHRLLLPPDAPAPLLPVLPLGPLEDGRPLCRQSPAELESALTRGGRGLRFASGVQLRGRLLRHVATDGRPRMVQLAGAELTLGSQVLFRAPAAGGHAVHTLPLTGALRGVVAGATRPDYHRAQPTSDRRVPADRVPSGRPVALDALYARGRGHRARGERDALRALHRSAARYPRDWLLRWNLLESLLALGVDAPEVDALAAELRALEVAYAHREPIALGLRTLGLDAA